MDIVVVVEADAVLYVLEGILQEVPLLLAWLLLLLPGHTDSMGLLDDFRETYFVHFHPSVFELRKLKKRFLLPPRLSLTHSLLFSLNFP